MMTRLHDRRKGFTLVELAIVLGVAAVLFTGLWRLLSGGNQQLKDTATASQQEQLISSVKSFLASSDGQTWLGAGCNVVTVPPNPPVGCPLPQILPLSLPPAGNAAGTAGCVTALTNNTPPGLTASQAQAWCVALPSGFSASTTNSYGQTYKIEVAWASPTSAPLTAPVAYSAMILTQGGSTIPDTSGGRISSQIGGDGGFVYSATPCALPACGSYGQWAADPVATFGFTAAQVVSGHVASRTYVSPEQASNLPWLARLHVASDLSTPWNYNTLTNTNLWLNASGAYNDGAGTGLNTLYGTGDKVIAFGGSIQALNYLNAGMNPGETNPAVIINDDSQGTQGGCLAQSLDNGGKLNQAPDGSGATCYAALQVNGNQVTQGMVQAQTMWAAEFLYGAQTSDIRMKRNVQPLGKALDNIMKLEPVTFRYKRDNRADIGFIAQDLQKIYPTLVQGKPGGILGVNYMGLIGPLVSSVQELKKQNDDLREQLRVQQQEIDTLKERAQSE